MFTCQLCQRLAARGESSCVVVIETRSRTYPRREVDPRTPLSRRKKRMRRRLRMRDDGVIDRGGRGREAARSVIACARCQHERG